MTITSDDDSVNDVTEPVRIVTLLCSSGVSSDQEDATGGTTDTEYEPTNAESFPRQVNSLYDIQKRNLFDNLSKRPEHMSCQHCGAEIDTRVRKRRGTASFVWSVAFCLILWPLFWIPLLCPFCKQSVHYCPTCHAKIGYSPEGCLRQSCDCCCCCCATAEEE